MRNSYFLLIASLFLLFSCGPYDSSSSGFIGNPAQEAISKAKNMGAIDVIDYQVDFSKGKKMNLFGRVSGIDISMMFMYQFPEQKPVINININNLTSENKKRILACGEGCIVTIKGEMTSVDEVLALDILNITNVSSEYY